MRTLETIGTLNGLIRTCRDAESICAAWARCASSAHLRNRFRLRRDEWARHGDELQALVLLLGGEPVRTPSWAGRAGRGWIVLRTGLFGVSDAAALDGCEEAQQRAWMRYESALSGYLPERIRRTLSLQARQIGSRCDRLVLPRGEFAHP
jgi:uncharacterized protein (TIGR02284 family)